jgi:hypothetical protein
VTVPTEHGGWGLTAEPALLGLLIAPSVTGICLGFAAMLAFVARTPLRVALVDRHRHRSLERTRLAWRVLGAEAVVLVALVALAFASTDAMFWWPAAVAAPLVVVELWFDMRSRSRRLAPELAGAVGISSVGAMIVLAGGGTAAVAIGAWLILAARVVTAIPHVRTQIARLHHRAPTSSTVPIADLVAGTGALAAVILERAFLPGALAIGAVIATQHREARSPVPPAKVLGLRQTAIGLAVVAVTAGGIRLA